MATIDPDYMPGSNAPLRYDPQFPILMIRVPPALPAAALPPEYAAVVKVIGVRDELNARLGMIKAEKIRRSRETVSALRVAGGGRWPVGAEKTRMLERLQVSGQVSGQVSAR